MVGRFYSARELEAVFMSQLSGSKPGSRNLIYNGSSAICKRQRSNCNGAETGYFVSTDEHLEVISTSLWSLREVTEENKQTAKYTTFT
jgi:hypothetical protein